MRTTLTLDEDVAAKLKAVVRRSGKPFREVVNDTLRRGLAAPRPPKTRFRIQPRSLGGVRPGVAIDSIGDLLERVEGSRHR